jgi:tRNA dimethylallyltransferase
MISRKYSGDNKDLRAVIVCGPTGSGKSSLAMEICRRYAGSIVSADSRQIYRRLDIGTAKPSAEDRRAIPHHMIDVADVTEEYSAMRYSREAIEAIEQIADSDRIPVMVGGTGLYIEAVTRGMFIGPEKDKKVREDLEKTAEREGLAALYSELLSVDPVTAAAVSPNDKIRIIRALEIYRQTGSIPSRLRETGEHLRAKADFLWIGLLMQRSALYQRIDSRVDEMIGNGLVEEVAGLLDDNLGEPIRNKKIVGYYEIIEALEGYGNIDRAVELVKQHSRNYAKRQITWFGNRADPVWHDPLEGSFYHKVFGRLDEYLKRT